MLIAGGHDNHPRCWLSADPPLSPFLALRSGRLAQHGVCAPSSRAASLCLVKGPLLPLPFSAAISSGIQEIEVRRWGSAVEWVGGWGHRQRVGWSLSCPSVCQAQGGHHHAAHAGPLLKDLLPCFPEGLVKSCSEIFLRVMTLNHVVSSASPSAWGCTRRGGAAELQTPGLCAGTGSFPTVQAKRELGPGLTLLWPLETHLIPGADGSGFSWEMSFLWGGIVWTCRQQSSPA